MNKTEIDNLIRISEEKGYYHGNYIIVKDDAISISGPLFYDEKSNCIVTMGLSVNNGNITKAIIYDANTETWSEMLPMLKEKTTPMSTSEFGKCDICGKDAHVAREYYHYDITCDCCNQAHFQFVRLCANCIPVEPIITSIVLKGKTFYWHTKDLRMAIEAFKLHQSMVHQIYFPLKKKEIDTSSYPKDRNNNNHE